MTQDLVSRMASLRLEKSKGPEAGPQWLPPGLAGAEVCAIDPSEDPGAEGPCACPHRPGGGVVTGAVHAWQDLARKEGLRCLDY